MFAVPISLLGRWRFQIERVQHNEVLGMAAYICIYSNKFDFLFFVWAAVGRLAGPGQQAEQSVGLLGRLLGVRGRACCYSM